MLRPGQDSALLLQLRIPRGFRIGDAASDVRMPAPTLVEVADHSCFAFGEARFPHPVVQGVPVHLGTARVFEGQVDAVIPFAVVADCSPGPQTITVLLTYTPAVSAGQLSTHAREPYTTTLTVAAVPVNHPELPPPAPTSTVVSEGYFVNDKAPELPGPLAVMVCRFDEEGLLPRTLHRVFVDPPKHGKHIDLMPHPYVASGRHRGWSVGGGMALLNTTREGIMTGTIDMLVYDNEHVGTTATLSAVSCPAAYHNYWFTAQVSAEKNRLLRFHTEDLTLGKDSRFGYELQLDLFQDPRYRFYGIGGGSDEGDETAYTQQELGGTVDLYWNAADHWRFTAGTRLRRVALSRPTRSLQEKLPYTRDVFGGSPGMRGATILGERLSLIYDRRNQEFSTSSGTYARVLAEVNHGLSNADPAPPDTYGRLSLEFRNYRSTADQRFTLLLRNRWQFTSADGDIPFYELATLGGANSLRGFDQGRFYGRHSVLASGELRVSAMHVVMMGFPMDLVMAPFVDAGQVFQDGLIFTGGVSLPL